MDQLKFNCGIMLTTQSFGIQFPQILATILLRWLLSDLLSPRARHELQNALLREAAEENGVETTGLLLVHECADSRLNVDRNKDFQISFFEACHHPKFHCVQADSQSCSPTPAAERYMKVKAVYPSTSPLPPVVDSRSNSLQF